MPPELLITNRKSILPWQPWGAIGPKSGGCVGPVLESSAAVEPEPVEPVELDALDEVFAAPVELPLFVSDVAVGPPPKVDTAGLASLQARHARRAKVTIRRMASRA